MNPRREDIQYNFAELLNAEYPGSSNRTIRAQILKELYHRKIPITNKVSHTQLHALYAAALESLHLKREPHAQKPPSWKSKRRRVR